MNNDVTYGLSSSRLHARRERRVPRAERAGQRHHVHQRADDRRRGASAVRRGKADGERAPRRRLGGLRVLLGDQGRIRAISPARCSGRRSTTTSATARLSATVARSVASKGVLAAHLRDVGLNCAGAPVPGSTGARSQPSLHRDRSRPSSALEALQHVNRGACRIELPLGVGEDLLDLASCCSSCIRTFLVEAFKIPSGSMERTLLVGDFLLVNKLVYGAEVPFTSKRLPALRRAAARRRDRLRVARRIRRKNFVKRLVGMPGDTLAMRDGMLVRNGVARRRALRRAHRARTSIPAAKSSAGSATTSCRRAEAAGRVPSVAQQLGSAGRP